MEYSDERSSKRRRLDQPHHSQKISFDAVDQLQQSLHFRQTITPDVRSAVNSFKDFLASISKQELATQSKQLHILRQYCDAQAAGSKTELDFPDLVSTWSFAAQSNNDSICSAIPAALAQFYKTISGILEFREFGLSLGHTLLKRDQVHLLERGLSSPKTRDHLISPCLRLLTELVSFDAGALAGLVFDRRDVLFKRLDSLLEPQEVTAEGGRRKPSVRRMALRLLIANLKYLDANAKAEYLAHGRLLRNCVRGLVSDGDDIVVDVLRSVESGLLEDRDIPRAARVRLLNLDNLTSLASLYDYELDPDYPDSASSVRDAVHEFLLKACTTRKGILLPQDGWYPVAFDTKMDSHVDDKYVDLGLDSPSYVDEYNANIPVKNSSLSGFIQTLRLETDPLQSALLLQILRSAPELVADYFSKKTKFVAPSGDDPSWRTQFALAFSVVQLPAPKNLGWHEESPPNPPPVSIVVESIVPRPLNRNVLSKYFTSSEEVLMLSAARLLIIALQKLRDTLSLFDRQTSSARWSQASGKLVEVVLQRVPKLQEVITALQYARNSDDSTRSALLECMSLYHQILPEATAGSKFDIGAVLSDLLSQSESLQEDAESRQAFEEQMLHIVTVAEISPATKWWSRPDSESLSLFTRSLRFAVSQTNEKLSSQVFTILGSIACAAGFLNTPSLSLEALRLSITNTKKFEALLETWLLLDNAIHRTVQRPVKYLDQIEIIQKTVSDRKPLSLLAAAVAEQWEYVLKKHATQEDVLKNVSYWIVRFYSALDSAGENFRVVQSLQDDMVALCDTQTKSLLDKAVKKCRKKPVAIDIIGAETIANSGGSKFASGLKSVDLSEVLGLPAPDIDSLEGLDRWDDKTDVDFVIQSGKVIKLLRCTSSQQEEIRRQAFQFLQSLMHVLDQSTYEEKTQVHLLLGELIGTIRHHGLETPLPSFVAELAVRSLQIISNPAEKMYGKINNFLLRAPHWDIKRLISFWIKEILFQEPEIDEPGSSSAEIDWLIQWLVDGLRTTADMEIYRRSGVFETILTMYTRPSMNRSARKSILTLIWRAVCAGGADTLITRVGAQNWLRIAATVEKDYSNIIEQLEKEIQRACDAVAIEKWMTDLPVLRT